MVYINVPHIEWANRYKIIQTKASCTNCKASIEFTIPFAIKGYRGLEAGTCEKCGVKSNAFCVVPVDLDTIEIWESLR